jgi:hypothetical protein
MPWGKLDDSLYDHPKVDALPDGLRLACVGLWAMTISYSNRHLTDGHVTAAKVRRLGGTPRLVAALFAAGLFEPTQTGILVHDFGAYNSSRDDVIKKREEMRELGKLGGEKSGEARRLKRDGSSDDEPEGLNSRPTPVHATPLPSSPPGSTEALGVIGEPTAAVNQLERR